MGATQRDRRERAGLARVQVVTWLLDDAVRVPFTRRRVGLDALLGLLPLGGDAVGGVLSLYVVLEGYRQGVRRGVLARMLGNVALDIVVGSVPIVGDVFDTVWKANARNRDLLETHRDPTVGRVRTEDRHAGAATARP